MKKYILRLVILLAFTGAFYIKIVMDKLMVGQMSSMSQLQ